MLNLLMKSTINIFRNRRKNETAEYRSKGGRPKIAETETVSDLGWKTSRASETDSVVH